MVQTTALDMLPQRGSGVRDYISPSRLNLWLKCPLAWKLRYSDGIVTPTTPSLFLGQRVHAALEYWYRQRMLGIPVEAGDVVIHIQDEWDPAVAEERLIFPAVAAEERLRQQTVDLVTAYLAQVPVDEPRPLAVESRWETPLVDPATGQDLGLPLLGFIDLMLDGPDGPVIIDFKTAAQASAPVDIAHELQLSC